MKYLIVHRTRQLSLFILFITCLFNVQAQVIKTIDIPTPGILSDTLSWEEKNTITNLIITGTIDARDFKTMRDQLPKLAIIDCQDASIAAYDGYEGTNWSISSYPENMIPAYAFGNKDNNSGKISLKSFVYPKSATSVGESAFSYCKGLTSLVIPSGIDSIGDYAFTNCINLTSVTFSDSLQYIGKSAFAYCGLITSIAIPSSVKTIGASAFYSCGLLNKVTLSEGNAAIGRAAFMFCKNLVSVVIPSTVDSIGSSAFWNCEKLTSLTISRGVHSVGASAFAYCLALPSVVIPSSVKIIGNNAFIECSKLKTVTIPNGVTSIGDLAFYHTSLSSIVIPGSVKSIGRQAFEECMYLSLVTINEGVESIGPSAFSGCINIKTITIPSTVTNFGNSAFYNCSKLESATISEGVTTIGGYAFAQCLNFGTVTIPSTITSIGNYAFSNCTKLTTFNIPEKLSTLGESAFFGCTQLKSITLPESLTSIPNGLFNYCSALSSVNIPASVTTIGSEAFSGCIALTSIKIPSTVTSIGKSAFYNCTGLTDVNMPQFINTIGDFAFNFCTKLTAINLPEGATTIGNGAFSQCSGISTLTIPASVTSIGYEAFQYCTNLKSITVNHTIPLYLESSRQDFEGVNKNSCKLYVPYGSVALYRLANQWKEFTNIIERPSYLKLSPNVMLEAEEGSKISVGITASTSWVLESDQSWLTMNPDKGEGNDTIEIIASGNTALSARKATIKVTIAGGDSQSYVITQQAKPIVIDSIQPGKLSEMLTKEEKDTLTRLVLIGTIDARDFKTMRDEIPHLSVVDMSKVSIAAYSGNEGSLHWKDYSYRENQIPPYAFCNPYTNRDQASLTTFIYPLSINSIGDNAFRYCIGLTSANLPLSLDSIGDDAFYNCSKLTSVTLPEGILSIGSYTFAYCQSLTAITIPSSVNSINENAFWETSLNAITVGHSIPLNLENSPYLFRHVDKTTCKLDVPQGTKGLYAEAFLWKNFTNISEGTTLLRLSANSIYLQGDETVNDSVTIVTNLSWTATSNQPWLQLDTAFGSGTSNLAMTASANPLGALRMAKVLISADGNTSQTVLVTQEAKSIVINATPGCLSSLMNDTLKNALSLSLKDTIDARDFKIMRDSMPNLRYVDLSMAVIAAYTGNDGTSNDTMVYYPANQIPSFAFGGSTADRYGKSSLKTFIFPLSSTSIGKFAFNGCVELSDLNIPSSVDTIQAYAFRNCKKLTRLHIPEGLKYIGESAFSNCSNLDSIVFAPTVTEIGKSAFENCVSLTTVHIPSSVLSVGNKAFYNCAKLNSATLADGVKSIGASAFSRCSDLVKVTLTPTLTIIGNSAFSECTSLASVIIPCSIGDGAFIGCTNLKTAVLSEGVKSIGNNAFYNCSSLSSVSLPSTLTEMGASCFYYCANLGSIIIPSSLKSIKANTFYKCDKLNAVTINEGVTTIGDNAFYECIGLRNIVIPSSVQSLGTYCFRGCPYLSKVTLSTGLQSIGDWAFLNCTGIVSITIPSTISYMGEYAFSGCSALSTVTISDGATSIGRAAFSYCSSLKSVIIPSSITSWGDQAFMRCLSLVWIKACFSIPFNFGSTQYIFANMNTTKCILYVLYGTKSLYAKANQWKDFINIVEYGSPVIYPVIVVDKGAPDKVLDLKAIFNDSNIQDCSITSNSNQQVVNATITGTLLTLDYSKDSTGTSDILVKAFSNGKETSLTLKVEVKIPTLVENIEKSVGIDIYPNPTLGIVNIKLNNLSAKDTKYTVIDASGRIIHQSVISNDGESFNLKGNPSGTYYLFIGGRKTNSHKIVLQ